MTVAAGTVVQNNLRRAFVGGVIDNDEKVAFKEHNQFKT